MRLLTYWTVNEGLSPDERARIVEEVIQDEAFPPGRVELVRWDGTPQGWGIALTEADGFPAVTNAVNAWRTVAADTGLFAETKTAPAVPADELLVGDPTLRRGSPSR